MRIQGGQTGANLELLFRLQTYGGHSMPVYAVRWNPLHPRMFLSAGADWTVKLWDSLQSKVGFCVPNAKQAESRELSSDLRPLLLGVRQCCSSTGCTDDHEIRTSSSIRQCSCVISAADYELRPQEPCG